MRGRLRLILINLGVFAVLLTLGLMLLPLRTTDEPRGRAALSNYDGSPWAAKHFQEWEDLDTVFFSYVEWRRDLFAGETINIVGKYHERLTPLPKGAKGPTVFFFGGSAMWGTGARDGETIPSLFAARTGQIARNFGESAYTAHQDLEMLMWLLQEGERPDVVVFYDGVNDVWHKCRGQFTSFSNADEPKMRWRLSTSLGAFLEPAREWFDHLVFGTPSNDAMDCSSDPAKARAVAEAMVRDWDAARLIAESQGIRFHAVLQPVAYFQQDQYRSSGTEVREEPRTRNGNSRQSIRS